MKSDAVVSAVKEFRDYIMYKSDSESTAKNYGSAVASFLVAFPNASRPSDISSDDIIQYLLNNFPNLSSRRNAHSAIKKFYKFKSKNGFSNKFRYIEYPDKPETIPDHVTKSEFIRLMQGCDNIKHRCVIMCGFELGLRVSEVTNLLLEKIDFELMQVKIKQSKGRKDRIVKLSNVFKHFLQEYIEKYKPKVYLFNGQFSLKYSVRSCEEILTKLCVKIKMKHHKFHELRHGFAMALHENGVDIVSIQGMMGHASPDTTEIYARKSNLVIQRHMMPLEQILTEHKNRLMV